MSEVQRKYLPTFAELVDRLTITQLKEVFITEHKKEYAKEIAEIMYDLDMLISSKSMDFDATAIRAIIVLAQMNLHIWHNESFVRKGKRGANKLLKLTHGLNGIRNSAKNRIQDSVSYGGRKDYKLDCLAAEFKDWEISWDRYKKPKTLINQQMEAVKAKIQKELNENPQSQEDLGDQND